MKNNANSSFSQMMTIGNELRRSCFVSFIPEPLRGMSVTQMGALSYIVDHEKEEVFQKDIEAHLRIRRSSVSSLLQNMEKTGLLTRMPVPEDARLKKLVLTQKGRRLCQAIEKFHEQMEEFMLYILTKKEVDTLASILGKIVKHLDTMPARKSSKPTGVL